MNNIFFSLAAGRQGEIQFKSNSLLPCAHVYLFFAALNQAAQWVVLLLQAVCMGFCLYVFVFLYSVLSLKTSATHSQCRGHNGEKTLSAPYRCKDHGHKKVALIATPSPTCCCSRAWPDPRTQRVAGAAARRRTVPTWQRAEPTWGGHKSSSSSVQRGIGSLRAHQSVSLPPKMETVKQLRAVTCFITVTWTWYLTLFWKVRKNLSDSVHILLLSARTLVFDKQIFCKKNFVAITDVAWQSSWSTP